MIYQNINRQVISILEGEMPNLLIVYLCETATDNVKVSFEHQAYIWADEEKCRALLPKAIISDFEKNHVFDIFVFKDLVTEVLFLFPKFEIQGNDYIYINRKWVQKNTLTKSA